MCVAYTNPTPQEDVMSYDRRKLSQTVAHALRHAPHLYELDLDDEGWTDANTLLMSLRAHRRAWGDLSLSDLEHMVASCNKGRYEMGDGRIRAKYGHSLPGKLTKIPGEPPAALFHGTAPEIAALIREEGIRPMSRQYVHLSVDHDTALEVGRRKGARPVLLTIDAQRAHVDGVAFYQGNDLVWLADFVDPAYIS